VNLYARQLDTFPTDFLCRRNNFCRPADDRLGRRLIGHYTVESDAALGGILGDCPDFDSNRITESDRVPEL
jgi:hypothetical protein